MIRRSLLIFSLLFVLAITAMAQLPAEAVQLDKVKIPEKQKAIDDVKKAQGFGVKISSEYLQELNVK